MDKRTEEALRQTSVKELLDDIRKTVRYVEEDGYNGMLSGLGSILEGMDEGNIDITKLNDAVNAYYGEPNEYGARRILPQYEAIAGYLQSVCGNVRYIEYKLGIRG